MDQLSYIVSHGFKPYFVGLAFPVSAGKIGVGLLFEWAESCFAVGAFVVSFVPCFFVFFSGFVHLSPGRVSFAFSGAVLFHHEKWCPTSFGDVLCVASWWESFIAAGIANLSIDPIKQRDEKWWIMSCCFGDLDGVYRFFRAFDFYCDMDLFEVTFSGFLLGSQAVPGRVVIDCFPAGIYADVFPLFLNSSTIASFAVRSHAFSNFFMVRWRVDLLGVFLSSNCSRSPGNPLANDVISRNFNR